LPGQFDRHTVSTDPGKLKAKAEKFLAEFVSSLGAVFGDAVAADLRSRADELEAAASQDDRERRNRLLFGVGLRRAADLVEHGDQPAEPVPSRPEEETGS